MKALHGRKALVTGAAGFLGSHLVRALVSCGAQVSVLVKPTTNLKRIRDLLHEITMVPSEVDVASSMASVDASCATDLIFHLAAAGTDQGRGDLMRLMAVNVDGTRHVMELARRGNARRVIYAGSCAQYGPGHRVTEATPLAPVSPYGISKAAGEMVARSAGRASACSVVSLRFFSPFGPSEHPKRLVPHTILSALHGRDVTLTPGEQTRDFLFVADVVEAFLLAAAAPDLSHAVINVCTGRETRVVDLVKMILRLMGDPVRPLPGALAYLPGEPVRISGDPSRAHELLEWEPKISLEEGLRETIRWFTEHADHALSTASGHVA